ncbi:hypothetical protein [Kitasatospora cheerisanensis]|uniref:Uncharacterized protein n=1 Tax=Kitasatospora cheerisanensis KCTC 2395 TaxID=1348663 RepID=A0A066YMC4_9ACTN|nr:hypothetical protein [Kitasatospora cheerisanensis]KDN82287.1 hypothetical protein KCH_59960 [Kitasatospora cheerisanensis KCTC 2395]
MHDILELDVLEIIAPSQEETEEQSAAANASWPYSCGSARNSRCR